MKDLKRLQLILTSFVVSLCALFLILITTAADVAISQELRSQERYGEFLLDEKSQILIKPITNVHGHVYPYTATVVTCSCIVIVLVIIIVCGPALG